MVFCGPSTAVVALGFASGNNGGLGSTKHTVSLGLSKEVIIVLVFQSRRFDSHRPDWISPFSSANDLRQENYNFRKPAKSTKFLKNTQSASPPICHLLIFYAKNSFVQRQVAMLSAKDLE